MGAVGLKLHKMKDNPAPEAASGPEPSSSRSGSNDIEIR
jgi:hypothetical protein